ncbi:MAG: hypothetical protein H7328_12175 [Bdellovibrio sp.]|nr:hypothetical protein [Bdellovibrio sp.]
MKFILQLFLIFIFVGCAPKLQEPAYKNTAVDLGPKNKDRDLLAENANAFADSNFTKQNLTQAEDVKSRLQQTEAMFDLASINSDHDWSLKANSQFSDLQKKLNTKKIKADQSIYMDLVYKQIKPQVDNTLNDVDNQISENSNQIIEMIRAQKKNLNQAAGKTQFKEKLAVANTFLNSITAEVSAMNLLPEFKQIFLEQLKNESKRLLTEANNFDEKLTQSNSLIASLNAISEFVKASEIELSAEDQTNLSKGQNLAAVLNSVNNPETALQAVAIVWSLLDAEQKIEYFKSANEDLYKFFVDKSESDVQCLAEKNCDGLKTKLILNMGVYPAIEKFGVDKISALINQSGRDYVLARVNTVAADSVPKIGETVTSKILISVKQKKSELSTLKNNFRDHLSEGFEDFLKLNKIASVENFILDKNDSNMDLETQTLYIRNKLKQLPYLTDSSDLIKSQFELIEGALHLPLFSKEPEQKSKTIQEDLDQILVHPTARQYLDSTASNNSEIKLNQQSEILLTMADYVDQLADWKNSSFDKNLSAVEAKDILKQLNADSSHRLFFAKYDLLPLVLSVASQTLKLMQGSDSLIVLIDNYGGLLPVQSIDNSSTPVALAAATDLKNGFRKENIKSRDLCRFQLSILQFYRATEAIENTQSELLKKLDADGNSSLNDLVKARKSLHLLIVALGNYLSSQLVQSNGLVAKEMSLVAGEFLSNDFDLVDQTLAIETLVKTYEATKIDVYRWTALDIFYSLNKNMYSFPKRFYKNNSSDLLDNNVEVTTALVTYKNLSTLKPYLNKKSQLQLEAIYQAWIQ